MSLHINEIWAWVSVDPTDDVEGVCAFFNPGTMTWMPFIAADKKRLDSIRDQAEALCREQKITMRLIKLSERTVVETLHPESV